MSCGDPENYGVGKIEQLTDACPICEKAIGNETHTHDWGELIDKLKPSENKTFSIDQVEYWKQRAERVEEKFFLRSEEAIQVVVRQKNSEIDALTAENARLLALCDTMNAEIVKLREEADRANREVAHCVKLYNELGEECRNLRAVAEAARDCRDDCMIENEGYPCEGHVGLRAALDALEG